MARVDDYLLEINRFGVSAVPATLWIAMAFLARHWLLLIIVLVISRRSKEGFLLLGGDFSWWVLLLEAPVLLAAAATVRRVPEAGALFRALWRATPHLLALAAVLNIALAGWLLWTSTYWNTWPELFVASCAVIDLAIVIALYTNVQYRHVFAEFPDAPTPATPTGTPK